MQPIKYSSKEINKKSDNKIVLSPFLTLIHTQLNEYRNSKFENFEYSLNTFQPTIHFKHL